MRIFQSLAQKRPLAELGPAKTLTSDLQFPGGWGIDFYCCLEYLECTSNVLRHHTCPINCSSQSHRQVTIFYHFLIHCPNLSTCNCTTWVLWLYMMYIPRFLKSLHHLLEIFSVYALDNLPHFPCLYHCLTLSHTISFLSGNNHFLMIILPFSADPELTDYTAATTIILNLNQFLSLYWREPDGHIYTEPTTQFVSPA